MISAKKHALQFRRDRSLASAPRSLSEARGPPRPGLQCAMSTVSRMRPDSSQQPPLGPGPPPPLSRPPPYHVDGEQDEAGQPDGEAEGEAEEDGGELGEGEGEGGCEVGRGRELHP